MSGYAIVEKAIKEAEAPENDGNGFTLHLWMQSGREFHGAVVNLEVVTEVLVLELWERKKCEGDPEGQWRQPADRRIRIDTAKVEAVEVCW